jgi:broad specificity phosphatase PhoE
MAGAAEVTLIRHAEADHGSLATHAPVYTGNRYDFAPLTEAGIAQAHQLGHDLKATAPRLVLSSPYTRTLQTAAIVAAELGCPLAVDLRLHDWLPVRDGQQPISATIVQEKIAEYMHWLSTQALPTHRTWETSDEMRARLTAAIDAYRNHLPLAVVTHEAPIQSIIGSVPVPPASHHRVPAALFSKLCAGLTV